MNHIDHSFFSRSKTVFRANAAPTLEEIRTHAQSDRSLGAIERRDLVSALNRMVAWTDRSLESIPANTGAVREIFARLSPPKLGISPKTFANLRSLVAKAVLRYGGGHQWLTKRIPLAPEWTVLLATAHLVHHRHALLRLATFCSVMAIDPTAVDQTTITGLYAALAAEEFVKQPKAILKNTISAWNRCRRAVAGWPSMALYSPFKQAPKTLPLAAFPASFQADVASWKAAVTDIDELGDDSTGNGIGVETLASRLFQIRQCASALVDRGDLALEEVTSLATLLTPNRFKSALRWFLQRSGSRKTRHLYFLARAMVRIARHYCKFSVEHLSHLEKIAKQLDPHEPRQMSARNRERLRQFDDPRNVSRLLRFSRDQFARAAKEANPLRAAKRAERAVAVSLMIYGGLSLFIAQLALNAAWS
jgi:hypothetical protein